MLGSWAKLRAVHVSIATKKVDLRPAAESRRILAVAHADPGIEIYLFDWPYMAVYS